jgi:hypothetical protein
MSKGPESNGGSASVDFDRLDRIADRLTNDERFERVRKYPDFAPDRIVCTYADGLYPTSVETARLECTWFENGEFSIHYHETHRDGAFDYRWDRHPSTHNSIDHVHPGPDAPTPGEDASHPQDWRDTLATVLSVIEERQRGFWGE